MNRHHIDIIRLSRGCVLRVSRCCRGCRGAVEGVEALSRVSRVSRLDPRHGQNMGSEKAVEFVSRLVSRLCRGCVELLCRGVEVGAQFQLLPKPTTKPLMDHYCPAEDNALADYIELSLQLQYNNRSRSE